jgi:hypothetical protein
MFLDTCRSHLETSIIVFTRGTPVRNLPSARWYILHVLVLVSGTHLRPANSFSPSFFNYLFFQTVKCLLMWGAYSDKMSGLYFSVFAGYLQRSLS